MRESLLFYLYWHINSSSSCSPNATQPQSKRNFGFCKHGKCCSLFSLSRANFANKSDSRWKKMQRPHPNQKSARLQENRNANHHRSRINSITWFLFRIFVRNDFIVEACVVPGRHFLSPATKWIASCLSRNTIITRMFIQSRMHRDKKRKISHDRWMMEAMKKESAMQRTK